MFECDVIAHCLNWLHNITGKLQKAASAGPSRRWSMVESNESKGNEISAKEEKINRHQMVEVLPFPRVAAAPTSNNR